MVDNLHSPSLAQLLQDAAQARTDTDAGLQPLLDALANVVSAMWLLLPETTSEEDAGVDALVTRIVGSGAGGAP